MTKKIGNNQSMKVFSRVTKNTSSMGSTGLRWNNPVGMTSGTVKMLTVEEI